MPLGASWDILGLILGVSSDISCQAQGLFALSAYLGGFALAHLSQSRNDVQASPETMSRRVEVIREVREQRGGQPICAKAQEKEEARLGWMREWRERR